MVDVSREEVLKAQLEFLGAFFLENAKNGDYDYNRKLCVTGMWLLGEYREDLKKDG